MTGQNQIQIVYGISPVHGFVLQDRPSMVADHDLVDVGCRVELNHIHLFKVIQFQTKPYRFI